MQSMLGEIRILLPQVMLMKSLLKSERVPAEGSRPANSPLSKSVPRSLAALRRAARDCKACDLWKNATQTDFW